MPSRLNIDVRHADLSLQHTRSDAALGRVRSDATGELLDPRKLSKSWLVAFQNRTHPASPISSITIVMSLDNAGHPQSILS